MPTTPAARRRLIARVALGTALVSVVWTGVLFFHGGFDTSLFGVRIRTNDPIRPMLLDFTGRLFTRLDDRLPAVVLATAIAIAGVSLGSKAAGGSDSYGYVSQAEIWLSGRLEIAQPWVDQVPWPDAE